MNKDQKKASMLEQRKNTFTEKRDRERCMGRTKNTWKRTKDVKLKKSNTVMA
jgi:hypothetical protein